MSVPTRRLVDSAGADTAGLVTATPDAYTQLRRLKDIVDAVEALGYAFSIGGLNFNDYTKIKTLWLKEDAAKDNQKPLFDETSEYQVSPGFVFIGLKITGCIVLGAGEPFGRFGEATAKNGNIVQDVLSFSDGTVKAFMKECLGVFATGKWITAATSSNGKSLEAGSTLSGVEVPIPA